MKQLHIYGQEVWHEEAFIVGDRISLELLRDCLNQVLEGKEDAVAHTKAEFSVNDGEGYDLHIALVSDKQMDKMAAPYTKEMARDHGENAIYPASLLLSANPDTKEIKK